MREHLFSGKSIDSGEWVEGHYVYIRENGIKGTYGYPSIFTNCDTHTPIKYKTLCQYTGREIDGVKLWENDLIKDEKLKNIYQIMWSNDDCAFLAKEMNTKDMLFLDIISNDFKIIGNVFDHPARNT